MLPLFYQLLVAMGIILTSFKLFYCVFSLSKSIIHSFLVSSIIKHIVRNRREIFLSLLHTYFSFWGEKKTLRAINLHLKQEKIFR